MKSKFCTVRDIVTCAVFTALIAVGAFIRVPVPVIPFTLQTLFTLLAGTLLGAKFGSISAFAYMALGLIGLPIFTQGGGLGYLLRPSFGYIIGFCAGAFIAGKIAHKVAKPSYIRLMAANFSGLAVIYIIGMLYFYFISNYVINTPITVWGVVFYGFLVTIPGDIVLCFIGAFLAYRLIPIIKKH